MALITTSIVMCYPTGIFSQQLQTTGQQHNQDIVSDTTLAKLVLARLEALTDLQKQSFAGDREKKSSDQRCNEPKEASIRDQADNSKQRLIMKKRLHKLLESFSDEDAHPLEKKSASVDVSASQPESARKRNSLAPSDEENSDEKIMILVKKPRKKAGLLYKSYGKSRPELEDQADADRLAQRLKAQQSNESSATDESSQWDILTQRSRNLPSVARANRPGSPSDQTNLNQHARRILDDGFGIMNESKFSTNNHIGFKGVPKFGSEEEY